MSMVCAFLYARLLLAWTLAFLLASHHAVVAGKVCPLEPSPAIPTISSCSAIEESLTQLGNGSFSGDIVLPTNNASEYDVSIEQYGSFSFAEYIQPSAVVFVETELDVQAAVVFAKQCNYTVSVRSGGHSYLAVSSCNSAETPCIQIDVSRMNQTAVPNENQLVVGPGNRLEDLAELLNQQGRFVPTGECAKVGLGGHVQTGGFGVWGRHFGALADSVASFRIVLADGSVHQVETPSNETSELNDDLFFAVLGGASGSWGVLTEITLNTLNNDAYFSVYWEVNMLWNTEGMVNMFRFWADIAEASKNDMRWSTHWTILGIQPLGFPSLLNLKATWVAPVNQSGDYNPEFFQTIIDACTGCLTLDDSLNETQPLSFSLKNHYINTPDGREFPAPYYYYDRIWQQTSSFPDAESMEAIVRLVDSNMPTADGLHLLIVQASTGSARKNTEARALPWSQDVFGIAQDFFYAEPSLASMFDDISLSAATDIIEHFGEDHRMFWGAYGEPDLEVDWPKYYDSHDKFQRLREIKDCVDASNVFSNKMSIPPTASPSEPSTAAPNIRPTLSPSETSNTSNGVSYYLRCLLRAAVGLAIALVIW